MMSSVEVPSIDISAFLAAIPNEEETENPLPTPEQISIAREINSVCRHHGFVHLPNQLHGMDQVFNAAKELFALPTEHKLSQLKRISPTDNMGYSPFASESLNRSRPPELKEAFNVRFPPAHTNDLAGCPSSFQAAVDNILLPQLRPLIRAYLHACAVALDLPPLYFANATSALDLCTVRFLHAPPCSSSSSTLRARPDDDEDHDWSSTAVRVGEHTDFGAVTFLFYDETSIGLQIKPVSGGCIGGAAGGEDDDDWVDVDASSILVNTGALMARWTNDEWKATAHRVIVPNAAAAQCDRYAMAVFVDPDAAVVVDVHEKFLQNGQEKRYQPISSLDFLLGKLKEAQGK